MGVYDTITLTIMRNFKKAIRHIMHMVVLLLLILILLSKTICGLSFRFFSAVITWLVKYGRNSKIWNDSSIDQVCANSCGCFDFQNIIVRNLP